MGDQDNSRELVPRTNGDRRRSDGREYDTLLPVQYYDCVAGGNSPSGEFKLFLAILEDALRCYVRTKNCRSAARRAEFIDARSWFYTRGARHVFSFESVCAFLNIEPDCLRARLEFLAPSDLPMKQFHTRRRQLTRPPSHQKGYARRQTASVSTSPEAQQVSFEQVAVEQISVEEISVEEIAVEKVSIEEVPKECPEIQSSEETSN